jgi:acyl-CoA dehydrogenase
MATTSNDVIWPRSFARPPAPDSVDSYLTNPPTAKLTEFFLAKSPATLADEDARELWHQDWLDFQSKHKIYASLLAPKQYSSLGHQLDLLNLTRFLEIFGYFSPSHGYSLQVSFLGLFSILMGNNDAIKREAVAALESGGLFAFGVSEKDHGSDLLANEFTVIDDSTPDRFIANGSKYYIGNANCAHIVCILARKVRKDEAHLSANHRRAPFVLLAIRPATSPAYQSVRKIRTFGIRSAFVGEFEVKNHPFPASDIIADGRAAWDAVFGTVTLGKFFLGFASIGICEHALEESISHLRRRLLYRKSVLDMPHIRHAAAQAYTRLLAMKLYAYRALDYVHAATATDRRYLLYCAVQKTKVSTEGVKVIAQLSECINAKGFESETYFESALRNIQLIPGLESSTHINLTTAAQFAENYFQRRSPAPIEPPKSVSRGDIPSSENPYLMQARGGAIYDIAFPHFLTAYRPLKQVPNVRQFARQAMEFAILIRRRTRQSPDKVAAESHDVRLTLHLAQCMATIAYGQLIAENAAIFSLETPIISAIFHLLSTDLSTAGAALASLPNVDTPTRSLARRLIAIPITTDADWDYSAQKLTTLEGA